jgi:hypothetical protein
MPFPVSSLPEGRNGAPGGASGLRGRFKSPLRSGDFARRGRRARRHRAFRPVARMGLRGPSRGARASCGGVAKPATKTLRLPALHRGSPRTSRADQHRCRKRHRYSLRRTRRPALRRLGLYTYLGTISISLFPSPGAACCCYSHDTTILLCYDS